MFTKLLELFWLNNGRARPTGIPRAMLLAGGLMALFWLGCGRQREPEATPRSAVPPDRGAATDTAALAPTASPPAATSPAIESAVASERPAGGLPLYEIKLEPKDLVTLERTAFSNQTVPATFTCNGVVYDQVKLRYRGAWARTWPKKPLKIFFNKEQPFEGQHTLNLNSGWHDPAYIRECLAYQVYAACGAPCSRARMARVNFNGKFRGLYVEVEQPEKNFVKNLKLKGASVYKAVSRERNSDERDLGSEDAYTRHYEKQTRKEEGYGELQKFCRELASTTNLPEFFNRTVDLEKYINYLAATVLVQNWDGFNKNHFLIFDGRGTKKWFAVPWDLDRTFGDHWNWSFDEAELSPLLGTKRLPGITGWNRLQDRFMSDPGLRDRFLDRLNELIQTEFTSAKLFPIVDQLERDVREDAVTDRRRWPNPQFAPDLHAAVEQVKGYIERRRAFLLAEIPKLRRAAGSNSP